MDSLTLDTSEQFTPMFTPPLTADDLRTFLETSDAEWLAGTDPTNAEDILRLRVRDVTDQSATLHWSHRANRSYRVEFATDWEAWETVQEPALRYLPNGMVEWQNDWEQAARGIPRFYRVVVDAP
jgi:hypothetical protein